MKYTNENLENTSKYFYNVLFNEDEGQIARDFLTQRGLANLDSFKSYEVGYCPPEYPYPSDQSLYLDNKLWWIRGRLIVTIRDQHNRIISFAGRVIPENKEKLKQDLFNQIDEPILSYLNGDTIKLQKMIDEWEKIKWINEFYTKKHYLFGLNLAKKSIFEKNYAIIVEGYMDALALWLYGFTNTVALCGVAMSEIHLTLLKRYTNNLMFCLDGDDSGIKAASKAENLLKKSPYRHFFNFYHIRLPYDEKIKYDPEETLKSEMYSSIFQKAIKESSQRFNLKENKFLDLNDNITKQMLRNK